MDGIEWFAFLRVALGLWWLESFRHKDKRAWIERNAGISWAASVAEKHKWGLVRRGFAATVAPRPKLMTWIVLMSELTLGLGLVAGFLTPIALVASALLCTLYFVLMIHDWAEQGQNLMMISIAIACLGGRAWEVWSLDSLLGLF